MEARKKRHICGSIHLTEWDGPYVTLYLTRVSKYLPIDRAYDHHVKTLMRDSLLDNNFITRPLKLVSPRLLVRV